MRRHSPNRVRFTKTTVAGLAPGVHWDNDPRIAGFGCRVSPRGVRTFFYQSKARSGATVKVSIGRYPRITPEAARECARKLQAEVIVGNNPAADKRAAKKAQRERKQAPTVADYWLAFEAEHLEQRRLGTRNAYGTWWRVHIEPVLGGMKLADITRRDVEALLRKVTATTGKSTAIQVKGLVSTLFGHAELAGLVTSNPAKGIKLARQPGRERMPSDDELRLLIAYLAASPAPEARVLELALLTGARRNEILGLRWSHIRDSWWTVPPHISKTGRAIRRPLNAAAQSVLAKLDRRLDEVVPEVTKPRLRRFWLKVCRDLGLEDLRVHDLRHAAASIALASGVPLEAVAKMLGHAVGSQITARYAHLADQQLLAAAKAVEQKVALLKADPAGNA
jgi:integrase